MSMRQETIKSAAARPRGAAFGLNHALLISLATGLGAIAFVVAILWPQWPGGPVSLDAPALPITIEGVTFNIPPAAIRTAMQRRSGVQERVDLSFAWPSLTPDAAAKPSAGDARAGQNLIFVSISSAAGALAPAERLRTIYPRYTDANSFEQPNGLRSVRFRDDTPFKGEDLYFDGDQPERFIARCTRSSSGAEGTCLLERRIGAAALVIRFPRDWLAEWRELNSGLDRLTALLRPAGG